MKLELPTISSLEAERAVIGALLIDPSRIHETDGLVPEHFGADAHKTLWTAILALRRRGQGVDTASLLSTLQEPTSREWLRLAEESTLSSASLPHHVAIVKAAALRRRLVQAAVRVVELAGDELLELATVREAVEREILGTLTAASERAPAEDFLDVLAHALRDLDAEREERRRPGVALGLARLDERTGGMRRGEVTLLAGKTGKGKSSLAWQVASNVVRAGVPVLGFTLEMEPTVLARRQLSAALQVNSMRLPHEVQAHSDAVVAYGARMAAAAWWGLHGDSDLTVSEIRSLTRQAKAKQPDLGLVVVDYLQLVAPPRRRFQNREREVAAISWELKALAKELDVAVLALSQLSRKADEEQRRPRLADLRESGALEHDAALVLALHETGDKADAGIPFELCVLKNRHGRMGVMDLIFHPEVTTFEEWEPPPPPPKEPKPAKEPRKKKGEPPAVEQLPLGNPGAMAAPKDD